MRGPPRRCASGRSVRLGAWSDGTEVESLQSKVESAMRLRLVGCRQADGVPSCSLQIRPFAVRLYLQGVRAGRCGGMPCDGDPASQARKQDPCSRSPSGMEASRPASWLARPHARRVPRARDTATATIQLGRFIRPKAGAASSILRRPHWRWNPELASRCRSAAPWLAAGGVAGVCLWLLWLLAWRIF
jgi:hypothetical protein